MAASRMSASGQQRTRQPRSTTSALPPIATKLRTSRHVRKVPESDIAAQEIWRTFSCILPTRHAEVLRNFQFSIFEAEVRSSGRITIAAT